jgi:F-type H+-transporting ATPase subunit delta
VTAVDASLRQGHETTRRFLATVIEHGRMTELPDIAAAFRELVRELDGQLDVHVTTAVKLTPELRSRIEQQLSKSTGREVTLHTSVDPAIIGGLIVQHGDTLIDTSLRGRLEQLRLAIASGSLTTTRTSE